MALWCGKAQTLRRVITALTHSAVAQPGSATTVPNSNHLLLLLLLLPPCVPA
jgi:hypothetical protein